jgi:hypothetical protein
MPNPTVELRVAKIPGIGLIAVHYWFVIQQNQQNERWEVWQRPTRNQTSWGHLHKNLLPFDQGVGKGDSWVETRWEGAEAAQLVDILRNSAANYPDTQRYYYWPGPNSNTYVQWILNQAKLTHQLIPQAIGKNHLGWWGVQTIASCWQFSTPLVGLKVGLRYAKSSFIELHILHFAISLQRKPWRFKTGFYY